MATESKQRLSDGLEQALFTIRSQAEPNSPYWKAANAVEWAIEHGNEEQLADACQWAAECLEVDGFQEGDDYHKAAVALRLVGGGDPLPKGNTR